MTTDLDLGARHTPSAHAVGLDAQVQAQAAAKQKEDGGSRLLVDARGRREAECATTGAKWGVPREE
jgi:hypothetical protein